MFIRKKDSVPRTSISSAITATEIGRRSARRTSHIMIEIPRRPLSMAHEHEAAIKTSKRQALRHGAKL